MRQKVPAVSELYPPFQRAALVAAAKARDWRALDAAIDDLARLGYCKPRHDVAMKTWADLARGQAAARGMGGL